MNIVYKSIRYCFKILFLPVMTIGLIGNFLLNIAACKDYNHYRNWCKEDINTMKNFYKF